jgi:hypothetical protein
MTHVVCPRGKTSKCCSRFSLHIFHSCWLCTDCFFVGDCRVSFHMCGELRFWFALLLTVILSLLPRFCIKILKQRIWPSDVHIAREAEILGRIRHQSQPSLELHELPPSMANSSPPSAAVSVWMLLFIIISEAIVVPCLSLPPLN